MAVTVTQQANIEIALRAENRNKKAIKMIAFMAEVLKAIVYSFPKNHQIQ